VRHAVIGPDSVIRNNIQAYQAGLEMEILGVKGMWKSLLKPREDQLRKN